MGPAALPRRDTGSREHLTALGERARPFVLARDRSIELPGELGGLVPGGALVRGSVLRVTGGALGPADGPAGGCANGWANGCGSGATAVGFELAAAITTVGEWAAAVDLDGTIGALAAAEAGVDLERFAVVRRVPPTRWATVVAALLEGVSLVLAEVPRGVRPGDARRLVARAREREAVLVVHERPGQWPADAGLTLRADGGAWPGLTDNGFLTGRTLQVRVEGRGAAARPVSGELARAV